MNKRIKKKKMKKYLAICPAKPVEVKLKAKKE